MLRFDRVRFTAFGLPALLNAILLPGYALMTGPAAGDVAFVVYAGLALCCLVLAVACVVKRGRDLGWSPAATLAGGVLSVALMPACLFGLLALTLGGSAPRVQGYGPPPAPASREIWLGSLAVLLGPWIVLRVGRIFL